MSSLKNHRVVIASLFLPNTVVLGESHPPSPCPTPDVRSDLPLPDVFPSHAKEQAFKLSLPSPRTRTPAPILSIVDDLKDKASMGPLAPLRFLSNVALWGGMPGPTLIQTCRVVSLALARLQLLPVWSTSALFSPP
jgi:hypothetical protein